MAMAMAIAMAMAMAMAMGILPYTSFSERKERAGSGGVGEIPMRGGKSPHYLAQRWGGNPPPRGNIPTP